MYMQLIYGKNHEVGVILFGTEGRREPLHSNLFSKHCLFTFSWIPQKLKMS